MLLSLGDATRARLFGILPASRHLTPRESDGLADIFGFDRLAVAGPNEEVRPIRTLFIDLPAFGRLNAGLDAMELRLQLRSSRARNDRIARLARRLTTRQAELAADASDSERPGGIILVVEDVKHAICLARKLPDWRIIAQDVIESSLTPRESSELAGRRGSLSLFPNAIVTVSALAQAQPR